MTLNYQKVWEALNDLEMVTCKIASAREILDSAIDALENGNKEKVETLMYATDEFLKYYLAEFDEKFKIAWKETVVKLKEKDPCMPPWGHSDLEYLANDILTKDRNSNFPVENTICDKNNPSPECKGAWNSFWEENYYPEEYSSSQYTEEELNAMCAAAEESEKHSSYYYDYQRNDLEKPNPFKKNDKVIRWRLPVEEVENGDTGEQEYFINLPDDLLEASNLKEGDEVEWVDYNDGSFILRKSTATKSLKMEEY
jgi:hypothetical protein